MADLEQHLQLQQQQPPQPPPQLLPQQPQQQQPQVQSPPHQAHWIPSSVRRNCDYCVKKKVSQAVEPGFGALVLVASFCFLFYFTRVFFMLFVFVSCFLCVFR